MSLQKPEQTLTGNSNDGISEGSHVQRVNHFINVRFLFSPGITLWLS